MERERQRDRGCSDTAWLLALRTLQYQYRREKQTQKTRRLEQENRAILEARNLGWFSDVIWSVI